MIGMPASAPARSEGLTRGRGACRPALASERNGAACAHKLPRRVHRFMSVHARRAGCPAWESVAACPGVSVAMAPPRTARLLASPGANTPANPQTVASDNGAPGKSARTCGGWEAGSVRCAAPVPLRRRPRLPPSCLAPLLLKAHQPPVQTIGRAMVHGQTLTKIVG